jgi:hypothetical protein
MQCTRLVQMIKSWYVHVREETMAPARMVSFMEQHVTDCDICLQDPDLKEEIAKITDLVLPESKIPKAVRQQSVKAEEIEAEKEVAEDEKEEDSDTEDDEDDIDVEDDGSKSMSEDEI